MSDTRETWYILEADTIHGLLYRARYERTEPGMLMLELSAMSNTVNVEDDE